MQMEMISQKTIRVAAYARVSTDRDDQAGSLESQKKYFTDFITGQENWQLTRVYFDEGTSGTNTKKRTGFNEMIADALCGEFNLILTKEVSRFARNTVDTLAFTRKLRENGVGVIFTIDNIDTRDSDGELRLTIMASIAQEESRKTSERVRWGQTRRMEQGVVFGRDMTGFTVKDGVLRINEEEAPIVRAVFHKYTNEGKGTGIIARELLKEGMKPKRSAVWSSVSILRMLKNEKYVGDLCQKKTITPDYLTHAKRYNRGEEEMVYIKDHHEPIIDRDLWDRTQKELKKRAACRERKLKYSSRYWCSGKIFCGECENQYVGKTRKLKNGEAYKTWKCRKAAQCGSAESSAGGKNAGCGSGPIHEKALLTCMKFSMTLLKLDEGKLKEEMAAEMEKRRSSPRMEKEADCIRKQIHEYRDKKRKMFDLALEGAVSKSDMEEQNTWYTKKITWLERRLETIEEEERIMERQARDAGNYEQAIDEILYSDEPAGLLYREILDKIVVYRDNRLVIWLKGMPFGIELRIRTHGRGDQYVTEVLEVRYVSGKR